MVNITFKITKKVSARLSSGLVPARGTVVYDNAAGVALCRGMGHYRPVSLSVVQAKAREVSLEQWVFPNRYLLPKASVPARPLNLKTMR